MNARSLRFGLIYCAVLESEAAQIMEEEGTVAVSAMLPQGLHDDPARLRSSLQEEVARMEEGWSLDAILLGYGLCSRGSEGVFTRTCPLVIPRAHDCITLLLGSRKKYSDYVQLHPGTYWHSVGWNKHHLPPGPERVEALRKAYVVRYGEDNADFLMEQEQAWLSSYDRSAFVDTGVGPVEREAKATAEAAEWLGWKFDRQQGSLRLIRQLVKGEWDPEEFLVLQPGQTLKMTADDRVVALADSP